MSETSPSPRRRIHRRDLKSESNTLKEEREILIPDESEQPRKAHDTEISSIFKCTPKMKSVLYMSIAMAVHFAGHEWVRGPVTSMFTSKETGFSSAAALPFTVGCVSPFSALLLWSYSKMLNSYGPKLALIKSTIYGSSFLLFLGSSLHILSMKEDEVDNANEMHPIKWAKFLLFGAFVFQSANVQFLYTQHWSFLSSVLSPEEGKILFSPIAGLGSITSTLAAHYVSTMVRQLGLVGLLCVAALVIGSSAFFADQAYEIASMNDFEPKKKEKDKHISSKESIIQSSRKLLQRVPILRGLFYEVFLSQCLSSLLNFQFMVKVKETIIDDKERAGWTGQCYAWINGISGILQFLILPAISKRVHERSQWIFMPAVMMIFTLYQLCQNNSSISVVGLTFVVMKTIEYSIRGQCTEIAFSRLDYESRFLGKEMINLFANRMGKSGMAVSLFLLTTNIEHNGPFDLNKFLVRASNIVAFLWLLASLYLTSFLPK